MIQHSDNKITVCDSSDIRSRQVSHDEGYKKKFTESQLPWIPCAVTFWKLPWFCANAVIIGRICTKSALQICIKCCGSVLFSLGLRQFNDHDLFFFAIW